MQVCRKRIESLMKPQLIHIALTATAVAILSSCDDNAASLQNATTTATDTTATTPDEIQTTEDEPTLPEITPEEVTAAFAPRIAGMKYLLQEGMEIESTPKANGDLQVKAKVTLKITEDLYSRSEAPAEFSEARKVIFALHQSVEKPDSVYLMDMGAETALLTDEDRKVKPLPENLQQIYNELVNLSESSCFKPDRKANDTFVLELTMDAHWSEGRWNVSNLVETEDLLSPLSFLSPASSLEEGAPILTQEFIAARMEEIAAKADAFKTAAEEYRNTRENDVRNMLTQRQAHQQEEALKAAEAEQKAAADAAAKQEWSNICVQHFSPGRKFSGEWTRDAKFGELTIQVDGATLHENAIQFYGHMYDTKLPQASIAITGRCSTVKEEDGSSKVNVTLYSGAYDPDEPTAEVYDAADGRLILNFDKNGNLQGIMTCASWVDHPQKNFNLHFKALPAPAKAPADAETKKQ